MDHNFCKELAEYSTVNAAIIYKQFTYWMDYVVNHAKNERDGKCWFYTSVASLKQTFPYLGDKAIRNAIDTLIKEGFVIVGDYSDVMYNKSKWYTLTEKFNEMFNFDTPTKPDGTIIPNEDRGKALKFIERWNTTVFKKVRSKNDTLLKKIIKRLSTRDIEKVDLFFNKLNSQPHLNNEKWFSLEYCVRSEENWSRILDNVFDFKKPKHTEGYNEGESSTYSV